MEEKKIVIPTLSSDNILNGTENKEQQKLIMANAEKNVENNVIQKTDEDANDSKDEKKSIYDILEEEIMSSNLSDAEKTKRISRLLKIRGKKVNIMLTGATGSGKSSTINALFNMEVAKVGVGVDPETDCIAKYELDNLIIWDTPGLGDGVESDERITRDIIKTLNELDEELIPVIDMVVVILDSSSKDLGTSYDLINNVLIPCLGEDAAKERILIALNQADIAMKGNHWDSEKNEPDDVLKEFLKKKADSVQNRIKDGTGLDIKPICYCAGYKEDGGEQRKPYNLTKLLYFIVKAIPKDKRLALADNINDDKDNWLYDDREEDYRGGTQRGFVTRYGTAYQMEFQQAVKLVAKSWESLAKLWEA